MKTRNFWLGAIAGGLAVGAAWYWTVGSYPEPHKHVWSRWRTAAPMAMGTVDAPANERHCKVCGFKQTTYAMAAYTPLER